MEIKIGNAPCSWGVIENLKGKRTGYDVFLDEVSEAGYTGTELGEWNFMPTDPEKLKDELEKRNLEMTGSWVNVYLSTNARYEESLANCLQAAHQLEKICKGQGYINLGDEVYEIPHRTQKAGRITSEDRQPVEQRTNFMNNINKICDTVEGETGVSVLFHHHVGTWVEIPEEIDQLLNESKVDLCFDSGHCTFGGGSAPEMLKKYADRIKVLHFKDCSLKVTQESRKKEWDAFSSIKHGIFPGLGKGDVDFRNLLNILNNQDYDGWIIVEQDIIAGMGNPKQNAIENLTYIKRLLVEIS